MLRVEDELDGNGCRRVKEAASFGFGANEVMVGFDTPGRDSPPPRNPNGSRSPYPIACFTLGDVSK